LSSSSSSSPATAPSRASSSAGRIGVEGGDDDGRRGSRTDEVEELDATVSSEQRGRHPPPPPVCLVFLAFLCMALPPPRNILSIRIPSPSIHPSFHLDAVVVASSSSHRHLFLLKCDLSSSVVRRS
jgi:hypothetical protein